MNDLFSTIYNFFSSLYGQDWDNFLYDEGYYSYLGLASIGIAVMISLIFYFTPTVAFHGKGKWFLFLLIGFVINLIVGYSLGSSFEGNGSEDALGETTGSDIFGTGLVSAIWGIVWFFVTSLICKYLSTHNKSIPF